MQFRYASPTILARNGSSELKSGLFGPFGFRDVQTRPNVKIGIAWAGYGRLRMAGSLPLFYVLVPSTEEG